MSEIGQVAIAMSGGIDSSVAAGLLKADGYDVVGLMLRLWSPSPEVENRCCSPADLDAAKRVAAHIGIPFYTFDVKKNFKEAVVDPFIDGYANGLTPNPCINCNRLIRWGFLLDRALALGATHLATGHYARVQQDELGYKLLRAIDRNKDQSYVLSILNQAQLAHALFPLGDYLKDDVRQLAAGFDLPLADRGESQDLCFLGGLDYRTFLEHQNAELPPPGPITDKEGNVLGQHEGLANYTIGQRKGIQLSAATPYYVLDKDIAGNRLIVGPRSELGRSEFTVKYPNWISGEAPATPVRAMTRVRYKSREVQSTLIPDPKHQELRIELQDSLPDITPGQAAVFYQGEECLGGGIISR